MEMKKAYQAPAAEVIRFATSDVLTASNPEERENELPIILF